MQSAIQIIDLLFTILVILLILRLLFSIIGSRNHSLVSAIFSFTEPIVRPFRGMVRSRNQEIFATLIAVIAVVIAQYIVVGLLDALAPHG